MILIDKPQFQVETGDITDFSLQDASPAALIAYLLAVEFERPGTLAWIVRQVSLIDAGWRMKTRSSDAEASIKCQNEGIKWMQSFDENKLLSQEGGENYAED